MNPFDLLKDAQAAKAQMEKIRNELKSISVTGSSGGGLVKVTVNGQFEMLNVQIDPAAVDVRDIPMLQDLIVSAYRQAASKTEELLKEKMLPMFGNWKIPGLG
ncbi:MAG: YbaB/EbfC family nucleoid-associated protein [Bacteroides sp.]|nr:YbaB/EbfC family nucleoid-associated protein [Prevotella sp.]MCM1407976.1 YbaB/EbfC family nucleoid-associated protein [Treponema brennaborense]MCM1468952.1 YbaB/EbfC family nucleoid-associated protein [Bacteroides sp.]